MTLQQNLAETKWFNWCIYHISD